jgi:hypothetical protein
MTSLHSFGKSYLPRKLSLLTNMLLLTITLMVSSFVGWASTFNVVSGLLVSEQDRDKITP